MQRLIKYVFLSGFIWMLVGCTPKTGTNTRNRTNPTRTTPAKPNQNVPIDTVRWTPANNGKPPIKNEPGKKPNTPVGNGETYRIGFLLPFLTNQADGTTVPEKSRLALQFYAGSKIALAALSETMRINLVVDVFDTQSTDADFQQLLADKKLEKPNVFIGPIRSSHVKILADWSKSRRKIVVSPESPNSDLATAYPDFIQTNPSLRAHCEGIIQYVRTTHKSEQIVLVAKEKEADRFAYLQTANQAYKSGTQLTELKVPDNTANFANIDLKKYLKPGKTAVFILPSWSNQDFIMAFLRQLKTVKGANKVEVYGMPQWKDFDGIESEYLTSLNVHISSSSYLDYTSADIRAFQQKFYETTGTIPDDDAFNGYDVTLFVGQMLEKYGLSFPERIGGNAFSGLHARFDFVPVGDQSNPDYIENKYVHILRFGENGYMPVLRQ